MDVFHHHLESVEASGLRNLDFCTESLSEILENDSVGSSEESKHMLDEVLLVSGESLPVSNVLGKVNLLSSPEASHLVLVHLPDVTVLDREDDKSVRVVFQEGLRQLCLSIEAVL